MEWTVSTTLFTHKPTALITASSSGVKAFEALDTLMSTLIGKKIDSAVTLLISAPKIKVSKEGTVHDVQTLESIHQLMIAFGKSL